MTGISRRALAAAGAAMVGLLVSTSGSPVSVAASGSQSVAGEVLAVRPVNGQTVGVAHPIIVTFTGSVRDRRAAERTITVTSPDTMTGRFEWLSDSVVQWLPDQFWPAHSRITLLAGGVRRSFGTGATVLGVASISNHTFTVSIDGEVIRQMPASLGKPRFATPIGSFSVLEKYKSIVMDSRTIGIPLTDPEGYKLTVADAVRITWGGVYVHSAPWSTGSQGYANVSHGCINLSPDNALWYYNQVGIGDPVVVNG
ncbi:MAG: L,D-transpeptidase family protein [Mycobacterium sp.]